MKINTCKKCGAKIVFVNTSKGNVMPVDFSANISDWSLFNKDIHTSHFATCQFADEFRKKKKLGLTTLVLM